MRSSEKYFFIVVSCRQSRNSNYNFSLEKLVDLRLDIFSKLQNKWLLPLVFEAQFFMKASLTTAKI